MKVHPKLLKHRWLGYVLVTLLVPMAMVYFMETLAYDNTGARIERTEAFIANLNAAYQAYVADNGDLPRDTDNRHFSDAIAGVEARKYYMTFNARDLNARRELVDAWGTPLRVSRASPTPHLKIESAGPDGSFGTSDDISNR